MVDLIQKLEQESHNPELGAAPATPVHLQVSDATVVADWVDRYFVDFTVTGQTIVGLSGTGLPAEIVDEIRAIVPIVEKAHAAVRRQLSASKRRAIHKEAIEVATELEHGVAWLAHLDPELARKLAMIRAEVARIGRASSALSMRLVFAAELATTVVERLQGLRRFDADLITRAKSLSVTLKALPERISRDRSVLMRRDRFRALLEAKVGLVEAAGRFAFFDQPAVLEALRDARVKARRRSDGSEGERAAGAEAELTETGLSLVAEQ